MWNSILEVLKRKTTQGVTVRLIYDDMGCFLTLPKDYAKQLKTRYPVRRIQSLPTCSDRKAK